MSHALTPLNAPRNLAFWTGLLVLGFALVAFVLLGPRQVQGLFNTDILLLSALHENGMAREGGYFGFQQARILSLFPDQAVYHPLAMLFADVRVAMFAYSVIAFAALTYMAAQSLKTLWPNLSLSAAALTFAVTFTLIVLILRLWPGLSGPYVSLLFPVNHSGPFIVSLWLFTRLEHPVARDPWLIAAVLFLTSLSDPLFLLFAVAPFGLAALTRLKTDSFRAFLQSTWQHKTYAGLMAFALCGFVSSRFFFTQGAPDLTLDALSQSLTHLRDDLLSPMSHNVLYIIGLVTLYGVILVAFTTHPNRESLRRLIYIAASMTLPIAFFVIFYGDVGASRYLLPLLVWPVILLAGLLSHLTTRLGQGILLSAALTGLIGGSVAHGQTIPALDWQDPIDACLNQIDTEKPLKAGLAEFWVARPVAASSNFERRMVQVARDGRPMLWGNDPYWYVRSDDGGPARFDFIVMKNLDEAAILKRYGTPDRVANCPATEVFIYNAPEQVAQNLMSDSPHIRAAIRF